MRQQQFNPIETEYAVLPLPPPAPAKATAHSRKAAGAPRRLRWKQMDERVARKVGARLSFLQEASPAAHANRDELEPIWSVFSLGVAVLFVWLYCAVCFHLSGPLTTFLLAGLPVGAVSFVLLPGVAAGRRGSRRTRPHPVPRGWLPTGDVLVRQAFREATSQSRAEKLYGDTVLLLAASHDRRFARHLLGECNRLVGDYFRLQAQKKHVDELLQTGDANGEGAISQVESERNALLRRLEATTDTIARAALIESVALCEERLRSLRDLPHTLARLEAQQEIVCQALSLAQTALVRTEAGHHSTLAPDTAPLHHAVRHAVRAVRAREAAVAELSETE